MISGFPFAVKEFYRGNHLPEFVYHFFFRLHNHKVKLPVFPVFTDNGNAVIGEFNLLGKADVHVIFHHLLAFQKVGVGL